MKSKLLAVLSVLTLLLSGCGVGESLGSFFEGGDFGDFSENLPKNKEERILYNGYADITVTLPTGYYITDINSVNLTERKSDSDNLFTLDRDSYGDGGNYLYLAGLQSHEDSTDNDHCAIDLYLEEYDFLSQVDYFLDFSESLEYHDYDGYDSIITDSSVEQMNGVDFFRIVAEVSYPDFDDVIYNEEYYIVPVGAPEDGLYFVAFINYWQDSKKSQANARYLLENCFQLGKTLPLELYEGSGSGGVI